MKCSYCSQPIIRNLTLGEVLLPVPMVKEELCESCRGKFSPFPAEGVCRGCQKKCREEYCQDCRQWQKEFPDYDFRHVALYQYDAPFKAWMMQYKIAGDYRLRHTFAKEIREYFKSYVRRGYLICPLPISAERFQQRGFNQVTALLEASGVRADELLKKNRNTSPQSEKNRKERMALAQPFALNVPPEKICGKKIILADDVYTTGRTIFHGAELILSCRPQELRTFSLAR